MKLEQKTNTKIDNTVEMEAEMFQPWSTFVMKTKLPPITLNKMLKITDKILADTATAKSKGDDLVGEIKEEFYIDHKILDRENLMEFFLGNVKEFVIRQTVQMMPTKYMEIMNDEWYTKMLSMWIVSQKDNEYNPIHVHTDSSVSCVMYLKIPKYLPSRKTLNRQKKTKEKVIDNDGSITFVHNVVQDPIWGSSTMSFQPEVGDFFIFPAMMKHFVYPFRTADGKGERRSVSFNAVFTSKAIEEDRKKNPLVEFGLGKISAKGIKQ